MRIEVLRDAKNPNVDELLQSLKHAFGEKGRMLTGFMTKTGMLKASITGMGYESGTAGMFNIRGVIVNNSFVGKFKHFRGFYDARDERKSGFLIVGEEP